MADERMLKVADAAKRLDINPETVRVWLRSGKLRGVKMGGDKIGYRIPESEIERLLRGGVESEQPEPVTTKTVPGMHVRVDVPDPNFRQTVNVDSPNAQHRVER